MFVQLVWVWFQAHWKYLAWQYGIDLFVTGHVHRQDVLEQWDWRNQFKPSVPRQNRQCGNSSKDDVGRIKKREVSTVAANKEFGYFKDIISVPSNTFAVENTFRF